MICKHCGEEVVIEAGRKYTTHQKDQYKKQNGMDCWREWMKQEVKKSQTKMKQIQLKRQMQTCQSIPQSETPLNPVSS